jgi:hypothetical protein
MDGVSKAFRTPEKFQIYAKFKFILQEYTSFENNFISILCSPLSGIADDGSRY